MKEPTFTYRADLGGNYMIHFITARVNPMMPGEHKLVMAILVDNAHLSGIGNATYGGMMVSIVAETPHLAIEAAKVHLREYHGANRLLDAIMNPEEE